jgi:stage II sporulation protein D
LTAPLQITAANGMVRLPHAAPVRALDIDGSLRVETPEGQRAESSGHWHIAASGSDLRLQLTLPSERYVMAALTAESAPDEPRESLKALAIVVRTYALANPRRHGVEGFDLCDSTHCQALRLGAPRAEIREAVADTAGETLWIGGHRAQTYFTQHCGGESESAQAAWGKGETYLTVHADPYCTRRASAEWHASISLVSLTDVLRQDGFRPPSRIRHARVLSRTSSGRAAMVELSGDGEPLRITASSLRFALDRSLGWQQVRSDGYDVTVNDGQLIFNGKGYGHGVGLCQAGAWQMAAEGQSAAAILNFYFPGTSVGITPQDSGWHTVSANGWSLELVGPAHQEAMLAAGNRAWARATALFPMQQARPPRVTLEPQTELFRQAAASPGWMLAVTVNSHIWLQPYEISSRNNGLESLLLHEMLHARIEQEATSKAPLWLREGLVEALADSQPHAATTGRVAAIDAALAHPADAMQSRRAHAEAAALAQSCMQRYGFSAVRSWLSSGVPAGATGALGSK